MQPTDDTRRDLIAHLEARAGRALPRADDLRSRLVRRTWRRGAALFHAGDRVAFLGLIRRGVVKFSYRSEDGTERVRDFLAEGQIAACVALLGDAPPVTYEGVACEDTVMESLDGGLLRAVARTEPAWAGCLNLLLQEKTRHLVEREHVLLTMTPPQRLSRAVADRPWLLDRVPQRDLAAYIGITPVSLSRLKARVRERALSSPA